MGERIITSWTNEVRWTLWQFRVPRRAIAMKKKGKRKEEAYSAIKRVKTKSSVKNRMLLNKYKKKKEVGQQLPDCKNKLSLVSQLR